jgi:hypothetical protein
VEDFCDYNVKLVEIKDDTHPYLVKNLEKFKNCIYLGFMKKIVYVTGCLGFFGLHVTRKCLEMGWYVIGVDKLTYASNVNFLIEFTAKF